MNGGGRLVGLTLSVLLHAAGAGLLATLVGADWTPALFVDLTAGADAPSAAAGGPLRAGEAARPAARPPTAAVAKRHMGLPPAAVEPPAQSPPPVPGPALTPPAPPAPSPPRPEISSQVGQAGPPFGTGREAAESHAVSGGRERLGEATGDAGSPNAGEGDGPSRPGVGGSQVMLAAPGTGGSGPPAEYGPYLQRLRQRIQEALIYPLMARRQGLGGTVELEVWIDPPGQIRDARVVVSSSHGVLDEAALETIRGLDPVPLPDSLSRRPLRIRIPLVFRLR